MQFIFTLWTAVLYIIKYLDPLVSIGVLYKAKSIVLKGAKYPGPSFCPCRVRRFWSDSLRPCVRCAVRQQRSVRQSICQSVCPTWGCLSVGLLPPVHSARGACLLFLHIYSVKFMLLCQSVLIPVYLSLSINIYIKLSQVDDISSIDFGPLVSWF